MLLKGNIGSIFLISCLSFTHFLIENDHMFIQGLNNNIFQKSRKKKSRTVFCHSLQDQMKHIARLSTVLSPLLQKVLDVRFNEILFVLSADQQSKCYKISYRQITHHHPKHFPETWTKIYLELTDLIFVFLRDIHAIFFFFFKGELKSRLFWQIAKDSYKIVF